MYNAEVKTQLIHNKHQIKSFDSCFVKRIELKYVTLIVLKDCTYRDKMLFKPSAVAINKLFGKVKRSNRRQFCSC